MFYTRIMNKLWTLFIASASVCLKVSCRVTYNDESLLRAMLLTDYDPAARPSTPTIVTMFYSFRTLQSLDIATQCMTTTGWMSLTWNDPRLVWNASNYSYISEIDTNWVWRPEFFIANSAEGVTHAGHNNDEVRFRVFSNGDVRWLMPISITTTCEVHIARFPFDSQNCDVDIVFWGLNNVDMVGNINEEVNTDSFLENAEWRYDGCTISMANQTACCPIGYYNFITYTFKFTRLRPFYVINLIIPAMVMSVCMVFTFVLPIECGERLGYSMTILLSYTVLMTITSEMMPTTSKETPRINVYLLILLIMCTLVVLSVVLSVKMFYLHSTPPRWLQVLGRKVRIIVFLESCASKPTVPPSNNDRVEDPQNPSTKEETTSEIQENPDELEEVTWRMLSSLLDRLCLYVFTVTVVFLIVIFVLSLLGYLQL